jgi:hypothetical protein
VTGGKEPQDPDEIERKFRELTKDIELANKSGFGRTGRALRRTDRAARQKAPRASGAGKRSRSSLRGWLIAVVIFGIAGLLTWGHLGRSSANPADDTKPVTDGAVPRISPTPTRPAGPPADPFLGSPAENYAAGQAGIAAPAAHAVGAYSAGQVQAAYQTVKKLLVAANLDPRTLRGGSPDAFARLLVTQQRQEFVSGLNRTGADKQGYPLSTRVWVTSFAPGSTQFVGSTIKVHGTMSAAAARDGSQEVIRVHFDYLFVYAVEPPNEPADWMRIVNRNDGDIDVATWNDPGGSLEPWLYRWSGGDTAGARCDVADGFVHPGYPTGPPDKVKASGAPVNPYDQSTVPSSLACRPTTGT